MTLFLSHWLSMDVASLGPSEGALQQILDPQILLLEVIPLVDQALHHIDFVDFA